MAVSPDTLATQLAEAGLVAQAELAALREQHQPADAEALARLLVKLKVLTAYQAQQAYAGKSKALVLGNYVILDKLGQGGMGMVLKARHRRMNRIVALKVLSPAVTKTPDAMKRFQREVEAAAKLHHPNIVTAHDADEVNGTHFLVMEYVEGTDLSVLVKKKGPLPVDQVINCMLQAARGLEYAHRHGVIHRDIKPANLLRDKDGTIKVLDMGLARIEGETGANAELTNTGAVMGTVDYMAPEQALSTKTADARSDIYSLGISLWYLLTARPAYEGDSLMARLLAHRETPPPSLKGVRSEVPEALDALFQKMIAKQPKDRCQSMTEVIAALEACHLLQAPSAKSTPSFTTGPSEESKLSEFIGLFGGGTDPNSPTRSVAGVGAPASRSEYDVTVTSATSYENTQTQETPRGSGASKPSKARPRWLIPVIASATIAALLFVIPLLSTTTKPASPTIGNSSLNGADSKPILTGDPAPVSSTLGAGGLSPSPVNPKPDVFAMELDGTQSYVEVPDLGLDLAQPYTIEAWAEVQPAKNRTLAILRRGPRVVHLLQGFSGPGWEAICTPDTAAIPALSSVMASGPVPALRLQHIAFVCDPGRKSARIFVDGVPEVRSGSPTNVNINNPLDSPTLTIGCFAGGGPRRDGFLEGRLHEFRVSQSARYSESFQPARRFEPDDETVALFHVNEGSGTVLRDSSGRGHDGRIFGAKWTQSGTVPPIASNGQTHADAPTSGIELDGIDDYIDLTSDWTYNGGPVTVELWTTPGVPALVEPGATLLHAETSSSPVDHPLKFFYLNPSSQVANDGELHLGRPPDENVAAATHQLPFGVRTHLAAVFDGKESTFFVDGRPLPRKVFIYSWPKHEGERFTWIGAARSSENGQTTLSQFWTGIVHNFRVSSSARYTSEFKPPLELPVDPATEGLYLFEEGAGSVATDSSGHQRHGKIVGGRWAAPGQPPADGPIDPSPGSSLRFDGSTAFVEVPSLRLDGARPITLEAWLLADYERNTEANWVIMGWNGGASLCRFSVSPWYSFVGFGPGGAEAKSEMGIPRESRRMRHLAGVWDGSTLRAFLDGQPSEVQQVDQLFRALRDNDALKENFCIGASIYYGTGAKRENGEFFKGVIDEVRVSAKARYSGTFTPSRRFEPDADTLALFHFDEGTGTVVRDASGKGHDGRIVGAKWTPPVGVPLVSTPSQSDGAAPMPGVELDGIDDYIDLTSDWTYDGGPVTVELWTTPGIPASDQDSAVLLRGEVPSSQAGSRLNFLYLHPSVMADGERTGQLHFGRPPDTNVGTARHTIQTGIRTHMAAVFDGKETTIFVDGRPRTRERLKWDWTPYTRERYLWIGASRSEHDGRPRPADTWTGIIHNVRVSSTARYSEEFVPPPDFEPDPKTEGLYRFREGTGTVGKDSSGHDRHARLVGGSWAAPGQAPASGLIDPPPGSYLRFDGTTAFVEAPSLRFDGRKPLTLEAWVLADPDATPDSLKAIMGWNGGASLTRIARIPWYVYFANGPGGEIEKSEKGIACEARRLHHVAGVWDGTTLQTFLDGKSGGARQVEHLFQSLRDDDSLKGNFCIGASIWYDTRVSREKGEFFKGLVDEVRVSQSARYSTEFTPSRRFEPDADTLALYHFDEGSGTEVRDVSGNGHHGKIVGAKWFTTKAPTTAKMASTESAPPPPAMAPFSVEQARIHQDAWAAHLQIPVEKINSIGMKFRLIPPGEYERGQGEGEAAAALAAAGQDRHWQERIRGEAPRHRVRLTQPFFLGTTEVTQGQFLEVTGRNPSYFSSNGPGKDDLDGGDSQSLPVENVSWRDVAEFCGRLSGREGLAPFDFENPAQSQPGAGYQLPSEAQWEFACRAGTTTRYSNGDSDEKLSSVAWFSANSEKRTHPVGQLAANNFGIFDLHGNVWELTTDSWDVWAYEAFKSSVAVDPRGPNPPGAERVVRGGDRLDPSVACRSAHRGATRVGGTDSRIGFRVVLSVEAVKALSGPTVPAK